MPKTPDYFKGKTMVITGAASGIGRATALVFGREGSNVLCADIDEQGAQQAPCAMLPNGPQWTSAGPPSRVCTRFGRSASLSSSAMAPCALMSRAWTGC